MSIQIVVCLLMLMLITPCMAIEKEYASAYPTFKEWAAAIEKARKEAVRELAETLWRHKDNKTMGTCIAEGKPNYDENLGRAFSEYKKQLFLEDKVTDADNEQLKEFWKEVQAAKVESISLKPGETGDEAARRVVTEKCIEIVMGKAEPKVP